VADESDVLFKEIEEDLRHDQANKLWATYGKYFVGAAVGVVIAVAAFQGWKAYDLQNRQAVGEAFAAAQTLVSDKKIDEAITAFAKISTESGGYSLLARFRTAALKSDGGDLTGAIATYKSIADDDGITTYYRDMATVLGAFAELDGGGSPNGDLIKRAGMLNDATNPWRHSAREILGLSSLKSGDTSKAVEFFNAIADDATSPPSIKARTEEMLKIIDG